MRIIAIANRKGGVGKTTTAFAIGEELARLGKRVLLVDLDEQCNLTLSLGFYPQDIKASVYDLLLATKKGVAFDPTTVILKTSIEGLHLMPAADELEDAESQFSSELARETLLKNSIAPLHDRYDYAVLDCPPDSGILTNNALTAATDVIIPVQAEYLAMRGAGAVRDKVNLVKQKVNPQLNVRRVLITMFDKRTRHSNEIADEIRSAFQELVFPDPIKESVRIKEAPIVGRSIISYDPDSPAASTYRRLVQEILTYA